MLKIVKREGNVLVAELEGEDHTLANLLAKYLIRVDGVKYASYHIPHPLVGQPVLRVVTDGKLDPLEALEITLKRIIEDLRLVKKELVKELEASTKERSKSNSTS